MAEVSDMEQDAATMLELEKTRVKMSGWCLRLRYSRLVSRKV